MLVSVLSGYCTALLAPLIQRRSPRAAVFCCAGLPLILMLYFFSFSGRTETGALTTTTPWVPSLGMSLTFTLDGLSLFFALIVTGIGALVLFYASGYLEDDAELGRFYAYLLAFMASMLGLVLAGNLLLLYLFWELTSITSYLLIGHHHEEEKSRDAALQALLVTGAGGLSLLAGFLLIGMIAGTFELPQLMQMGGEIRAHPLYLPALLLILAGAFAKSAQVPFHFWLPTAMAAPTPVSAYLHSAAMVKAGLYLLARLTPVLGGTEAWHFVIAAVGGTSMVVAGVMSFLAQDLKRILAYSTVSALGMMTLLIGIGTTAALHAFAVYLLVHVLYKGALFLVAGAVDHACGTRELHRLGGLASALPAVALAAVLAGVSMAGIPPTLGFIGKESIYKAGLQGFLPAAVASNAVMVAVAGMVGLSPFLGSRESLPREPHHVSGRLWLAPLVLAVSGVLSAFFPGTLDHLFFVPATAATGAGRPDEALKLWHGFSPEFFLGLFTVGSGIVLYAARQWLAKALRGGAILQRVGPERIYRAMLTGILTLAERETRMVQAGYLRRYLKVVLGTAVALVALALLRHGTIPPFGAVGDVHLHEWLTGALIVAGAVTAALSESRLGTVAALGVVGYGASLVYLLFGAPDLAVTQFCIETLTVILFVLVLHRLPHSTPFSTGRHRLVDMAVALAGGAMMTLMTLLAISQPLHDRVSRFFAENSKTLAHGRNVVNVILVDFRALDTMGEITVLSISAVGVFALLKLGGPGEE